MYADCRLAESTKRRGPEDVLHNRAGRSRQATNVSYIWKMEKAIKPDYVYRKKDVMNMKTDQKKYEIGAGRPGITHRAAVWLGVCLLAVGIVISGCAGGNYGRFNRSAEVAADFEKGQSNPQYDYYFYGRELAPHAIIGIDKTYRVPSKLWKAFTPTPAELKRMADYVLLVHNALPYGAYIVDASGNRLGVWYSRIVTVHAEVDEANKTIVIAFADPENDGGGRLNF